jgi:membrane protease subunit (stomatin/prohibitin family)
MGETIDSILNLPAKYNDLSTDLSKRLQEDFSRFGLGLTQLYINSITPPAEVQQAIDDRSRMGVFKDMDKLMQMKAAMAMEKAADAQSGSGAGLGMGTGLGLMMPAMFAQYFAGPKSDSSSSGKQTDFSCPECQNPIPTDARFCPQCGHQQLVFDQCSNCAKNLKPHAQFCSRCGHPVKEKPKPKMCANCRNENLSDSMYCNQCGEKL